MTQQTNEVLMGENEDDVPLSLSKLMEEAKKKKKMMKQRREESEEMQVKKKAKFKWRQEDCAKSIGKLIKLTGDGEKMKSHYETFEFHGSHYGLEDTVLLVPENVNQKPYIAIIKDIYVQEKDGYVKLEVQWLYRKEDIDKKCVEKLESKDSREVFFSFHRDDEVFAESVKHKCLVYFVQDDKQIQNITEHPDFIVQKVYDNVKKKLRKLSDKNFKAQQKLEINVLVAKTISIIGDIPEVTKLQKTKTSRRKRSVTTRYVDLQGERMSSENITEVDSSKELESLPSRGLDRDKRMGELLEAVLKHMCCANKEKQADDFEFVRPNDVNMVVFGLEEALYDSFADDIPKYNNKLKFLIEKLKNRKVLVKRLLKGELKPEQVIKMNDYELLMADFEEPKVVGDVGSTSKSVGDKDSLED